MVTQETVGDRIQVCRRLQGLSLSQLADLAGLSRQHLHQAEHGVTQLTVPKLQAIAQALGVRCGVLLGEEALFALLPNEKAPSHDC